MLKTTAPNCSVCYLFCYPLIISVKIPWGYICKDRFCHHKCLNCVSSKCSFSLCRLFSPSVRCLMDPVAWSQPAVWADLCSRWPIRRLLSASVLLTKQRVAQTFKRMVLFTLALKSVCIHTQTHTQTTSPEVNTPPRRALKSISWPIGAFQEIFLIFRWSWYEGHTLIHTHIHLHAASCMHRHELLCCFI